MRTPLRRSIAQALEINVWHLGENPSYQGQRFALSGPPCGAGCVRKYA
jgi:hypothetical protein